MPAKSKKVPEYISQRKFAKMMGVTHTAITQAIDSGRISNGVYVHPGNGHRKILPEIATLEWEGNPAPDDKNDPTLKRGGGVSDSSSLTAVKLLKEKIIVRQQNIKLKQMEGALVEKDKVYKELFEFGKMLRDSILVIPDRIVDQVRAAKTRNECHNILTIALEDALRGLGDLNKIKFDEKK